MDQHPAPHRSPENPGAGAFGWTLLVLLAAASFFGINFYHYPSSNHFVTVPFILDLLDPARYPGDPLIAEREHFYTIYNDLLAWIVRLTGLEVATLFHLLFAVALPATFLAFYRLCATITGRRDAALFAAMVLLFGVRCLGGVRTIEGALMERSLALPIELLAFAALLEGRLRRAFAAVGIAFLIHPLSGAYCFAALVLAAVVSRELSFRRLLGGVGIFLVAASPVILGKFLGAGPRLPFFADAGWVDLLMQRSALHVDPWSWPVSRWIGSLGFVAGFVWLALRHTGDRRRRILGLGLAVVGICVAGIVFVVWVPVSLAVQMQPFRSFRFLVYLGFALCAAEVLGGRNLRSRLLAAALLVGFAYGSAAYVYIAPGVLLTVLAWWPVRAWLRGRERWHRGLLVAFVVAAGVFGWLWNGVWIGNAASPSFVRVQTWARDHTPLDAGFIVPPDELGFRLESRRAIYGDWKDGTQAFFNPEFGRAWLRRMERLGCPPLGSAGFADEKARSAGYAALGPPALQAIAAEMTRAAEVYAVTIGERPDLGLPEVFRSSRYRVYRVR